MWRQLSGFEKFRFVACFIGLPAAVFAATLSAMDHRWFNAALQAVLVLGFVYYLYKYATRGRGSGEETQPQPSSNPAVVIGSILVLIALGAGGVFGYQRFFVKHGPPPITMNAEDNSFTVSVPPNWQTANVPHAKAYVLLLAREHGGSMGVVAKPAKSTLQELAKSNMDQLVNQAKVVVDPGGDLQPTTVDGEAALSLSFTLTQPVGEAPAGAHSQSYFMLHRNVEYMILFFGAPDEYAGNHAEFDAIMHSWKWSTAPSATVTPAEATLERLLLSPGQIDTATNTTGMTADHFTTTMTDVSAQVSDPACRPLSGTLIAQAYAGSGWSAFREQLLTARANSQVRSVDQGVVSFPSAHDAEAFFTASAQQWPACSNRQHTETPAGQPDVVWSVGPVSNTDGTLSYTSTPEGHDGVACQRALTVAANIAIDVNTCGGAPSGAAVDIAHQIAAKVPTQ